MNCPNFTFTFKNAKVYYWTKNSKFNFRAWIFPDLNKLNITTKCKFYLKYHKLNSRNNSFSDHKLVSTETKVYHHSSLNFYGALSHIMIFIILTKINFKYACSSLDTITWFPWRLCLRLARIKEISSVTVIL